MSIFLNILLGFLTSFLVLTSFRFFEKERNIPLKRIDYLFVVLIVFLSYIYKPSQSFVSFFLWIGISLLAYSALDDFKSKTLDIKIPLIVTLFFFIIDRNPYSLLISFFVFVVILLFIYGTKETVMGKGDAYFLFPLLVFVSPSFMIEMFYLSFILGIVILTIVQLVQKEKEHAFTPFFLIGSILVVSHFYLSFILPLFTGLLFICTPILFVLSRKKD